MGGMTPRNYLEEFVEPNHAEFANAPNIRRLAFNDSVTAYHMRDHMWHYYNQRGQSKPLYDQKTMDDYTECLKGKMPDAFWTVQVVATSYKHLYCSSPKIVTKRVSANSVFNSVGNFYYDPAQPFSYLAGPVEIRNYSRPDPRSETSTITFTAQERVFVDVAPDLRFEILEATDRVVAYWREAIAKWG